MHSCLPLGHAIHAALHDREAPTSMPRTHRPTRGGTSRLSVFCHSSDAEISMVSSPATWRLSRYASNCGCFCESSRAASRSARHHGAKVVINPSSSGLALAATLKIVPAVQSSPAWCACTYVRPADYPPLSTPATMIRSRQVRACRRRGASDRGACPVNLQSADHSRSPSRRFHDAGSSAISRCSFAPSPSALFPLDGKMLSFVSMRPLRRRLLDCYLASCSHPDRGAPAAPPCRRGEPVAC